MSVKWIGEKKERKVNEMLNNGGKTWFYLMVIRFVCHCQLVTAVEGGTRLMRPALSWQSMKRLLSFVGGFVVYIFLKCPQYYLSDCRVILLT